MLFVYYPQYFVRSPLILFVMLRYVNTRLFTSSKHIGKSVYIVAAKRTPIGAFNGKLSAFSAIELGSFAVKGALDSISLNPKEID